MEVVPDDRPPTRKQEQLIAKLVKDFPDTKALYEYEDYIAKPTKVAASEFITLALESNWDSVIQSEQYMKYIATRPRAERFGSHGLFSDDDTVSLDNAMTELENYTGNVWTHIISLKREDAERLGYNNASAWRDLLRAHRNQIADAMKIHPNDFCWYAAFHDEGHHPHVHMMAWSAKPGQAYLTVDGIKQIRSKLTNDIFQDEMYHLYEQKSESRDELVHEARKTMLELAQQMKSGICDHPEAENLMLELAMQLQNVSGKKSYGYLPKKQKALVDKIVDQMERIRSVSQAYDKWLELQNKVDGYYDDKPRERVPLSQQKEFRAIKNAVIKQVEHIRRCDLFFEDKGVEAESEPEDFEYCSRDYWDYRSDIYNEDYSLEDRLDAINDMEQLAREGDMDAQYLMGKLWRDGPLVTPDSAEAKYWFTQAAQQGHMYAQYSLGKLYLSDDIEVRDAESGIRWLEISAQNGNDYAAYRLGKASSIFCWCSCLTGSGVSLTKRPLWWSGLLRTASGYGVPMRVSSGLTITPISSPTISVSGKRTAKAKRLPSVLKPLWGSSSRTAASKAALPLMVMTLLEAGDTTSASTRFTSWLSTRPRPLLCGSFLISMCMRASVPSGLPPI